MLSNECGFPIIEEKDFVSPAALRDLADAADSLFMSQEAEISLLERPEAAIFGVSSTSLLSGAGVYQIDFDTVVHTSRYGAFAFGGIYMSDSWRPGIYQIGAHVDGTTSGTIDSIYLNLNLYDRRGSRLLNEYTEFVRHAEGNMLRAAVALHASQMVEIHNAEDAIISAGIGLVGTGSYNVQTSPKLWAHRVRGLSDV